MIKLIAAFTVVFFAMNNVAAQYYYKDLVSNKQAADDMARYRQQKVKTIKLKSIEGDGTPSEGFFAERKISSDYKKAQLFTRSSVSGASLQTSIFNDKGKLVKTTDSSEIASTNISYFYDEDDRVTRIVSSIRSADDDFVNEILEEHIYVYEDQFYPVKMLRVRNRLDTTTILFMLDENNNIAIEKDTKNGSKYYYYYDSKSRLTDIAHANEFKPKLLADYMFSYDNDGQLIEMMTTEEGGNYYYIWKYAYNNGLRIAERLYNKERNLMGTVEYEYRR